jgi:hypothetical protein
VLNAKSGIDDILQALYARGQNLKDFTADVAKTETDNVLGKSHSTLGTVRYRKLSNDDVEIRVTFEHEILGDNKPIAYHQDYKLADGQLIVQKYDQKLEQHMTVAKPGQKLDPIKLGEGAFPLPVGQEPGDVKKQFEVKLIPHDQEDPPHTIHAQLTPKVGTKLANKFQTIDVWVDTQTNFTPRIETVPVKGVTTTTTELTNLKVNSGLKDADFQLPAPQKDWSVSTENLED